MVLTVAVLVFAKYIFLMLSSLCMVCHWFSFNSLSYLMLYFGNFPEVFKAVIFFLEKVADLE